MSRTVRIKVGRIVAIGDAREISRQYPQEYQTYLDELNGRERSMSKLVVDREWLETVMNVAGGVRLGTIDHLHCGAVDPDACGEYKSCAQCLIENSNGAVSPLAPAQERAGEQIMRLEDTVPSGIFSDFYQKATGRDYSGVKKVSLNDIRRCLMLFHNLRTTGTDIKSYLTTPGAEKGGEL